VEPEQIDSLIDNSSIPSAAIYAIALPKKLAVIVKLPNRDPDSDAQDLLYYSHNIEKSKLEATVNDFIEEFKSTHPTPKSRKLGKKLYDWLLLNAEENLQQKDIQNLVFILDTKLQRIPMAALVKDQKYLIRDYSVTLVPSLQLLQSEPVNVDRVNVLGAGVSEKQVLNGQEFSALPKVKEELERLEEQISNSEILLNEEFKKTAFQNEVKSDTFPIIHIATHGQFSSNVEETYVIVWRNSLKITDLESIIQTRATQPVERQKQQNIELLILTACETAKGDERATLGLAGLSVRAGARSTIASLRRVEEAENIYLIEQFYNQLLDNPNISKAKALQQAQIALLERGGADAPYYWATYVLVGNWE
jgi:CHAT domain-containing protein